MKNILVTTDFSENAWNATRYAIELLKNEECVFHLLNTYTPAIVTRRFMAATIDDGSIENGASLQSKRGLQNWVERIVETVKEPKHSFKTISSFSFLVDEIKKAVDELEIDLIVTGTKGATGYAQVFLGTNTVRMIKTVKGCPILAVPENYQFQKPKHIAFPTDFKHNFSADVLHPLLELAKRFDAETHIMHIDEESKRDKFQESNMNTLMVYMAPVLHKVHFVPHYSAKSNVIAKFLEELQIDMLALVYNEHNFLDKLMRDPVVANMAYHCKIPLLVLPN